MDRYFDYCFVATAEQHTKNHDLFVEFIKYCEKIKVKKNFIYVGDYSKLYCFKDFNYYGLEYCSLIIRKEVTHHELKTIYNQSKINILFSGRDCNPRVITESLACGCFNIAMDTLTEGKFIYDNEIGVLIGSKEVEIRRKKANSVAYAPSNIIFNQILEKSARKLDHKKIAIESITKFTLSKNINNIKAELDKISTPYRYIINNYKKSRTKVTRKLIIKNG